MNYVCNAGFESFVCVDLETTGLSSTKDGITEIGAIKVINGRAHSKFSTLVNPGIRIPQRVVDITGITNEMVSDAPVLETVLPAFLTFVGDLPLVAHNAKFDGRFLDVAFSKCGLLFQNPMDDTLAVARKKCMGLKSYKLGDLAVHFNIPLNHAHRAWCDAQATAHLYIKLQKL